jgi:hypothetical protein
MGTAVRGSSKSRRKPMRERNVSRTDAAVSQGSRPHGWSSKRSACTAALWLTSLLGLDCEEEVFGARVPGFEHGLHDDPAGRRAVRSHDDRRVRAADERPQRRY